MPFSFGEEPSNTGEFIGVQCIVTKGDLPLTIEWYLNGDRVMHNDNFVTISKNSARISALNVDSLNDRHRGVYKCLASNKAGSSEMESTLFVNGSFGGYLFIVEEFCHAYVNPLSNYHSITHHFCSQ